MGSYATDGRCHNAEPGTFNHECGNVAVWLGTKATGFQSGFCDYCKEHGWERQPYVTWEPITPAMNEYNATASIAAWIAQVHKEDGEVGEIDIRSRLSKRWPQLDAPAVERIVNHFMGKGTLP